MGGEGESVHRAVLSGLQLKTSQAALFIAVSLHCHVTPNHLNLGVVQRSLLHDLAGTELVSPVDDEHLRTALSSAHADSGGQCPIP